MRRAAKRFINYIRSERGMSPSTVHSYRQDLRKFIEFLEKHWGRYLLPAGHRGQPFTINFTRGE